MMNSTSKYGSSTHYLGILYVIMMRIAVAGGIGLGYLIAEGLANAEIAYNVVVLSRYVSMTSYLTLEALLISTKATHFRQP